MQGWQPAWRPLLDSHPTELSVTNVDHNNVLYAHFTFKYDTDMYKKFCKKKSAVKWLVFISNYLNSCFLRTFLPDKLKNFIWDGFFNSKKDETSRFPDDSQKDTFVNVTNQPFNIA